LHNIHINKSILAIHPLNNCLEGVQFSLHAKETLKTTADRLLFDLHLQMRPISVKK